MTPTEAAAMIEHLPANEFKQQFLDLLQWQVRYGKQLVHVGWYLHCLKYRQMPRDHTPLKVKELVREVVKGRGK